MIRRWLLAALVFALAGLVLWGWYADWRAGQHADADARHRLDYLLRARGYHRPTGRPERPTDLPPGATPVATLRGRIPYGPKRPAQVSSDSGPVEPSGAHSGPAAPGPGPAGSPDVRSICAISPEDIAGGCRAEIVAPGPGEAPMARLWWDGSVRLPDGGEVRRGPVLADEVEFQWAPLPARPRALVGVDLGGVLHSGGLAWEAGARYYPARWQIGPVRAGGYARWESDGRGAVGVSVLIGAR